MRLGALVARVAALRHWVIRQPLGTLGAALIVAIGMVGVVAPSLAPASPVELGRERLAAPSSEHRLGTDDLGRDILSRLMYGARISLWVGILSVAIATGIGVSLGIAGGTSGGWLDLGIGAAMDLILAFPPLLLAMFVTAMLGPNLLNATLAMGVVFAPTFARLSRGMVLSENSQAYVEAARALGASPFRVVFRHILPNILGPLVVQATLTMSWAILTEAVLSYIGLGTQPPTPSWGAMLNASRSLMQTAPWTAVFPGVAIMVTVLGFNLLGDGLRDVLDPRSRAVHRY